MTKELYEYDDNFTSTFASCLKKPFDGFYLPQGSIKKLIIKESHEGDPMDHYEVDITLSLLKKKNYWPHMRVDIQRHYYKCITCLQAKSKIMSHGL